MKTKLSLLLVLPLLAFGAQNRNGAPVTPAPVPVPTPAATCPADGSNAACPMNTVTTGTPTTLTSANLIFAIEEERVAHDIYAAAAARWDLRVFANIAESETRHAAALTQLAATVGVQPPAAKAGVYATADLQALYDQLLVLVNGSATGALRAGALIEETDIADLRRLSAQATDEGSKAVIANLVSASVNHLGAFVRNLAAAGVTYQPQVLSAEEFATMTSAAPGRGGMGKGKGNGNGMGGGNAACGADCTGTGAATPAPANPGTAGRGYRGGR
jgi:hypothetical protein